jgi:hypothetical protein
MANCCGFAIDLIDRFCDSKATHKITIMLIIKLAIAATYKVQQEK